MPVDREFILDCLAMLAEQRDEVISRLTESGERMLKAVDAAPGLLDGGEAVIFNLALYNSEPPAFIAIAAISANGLPDGALPSGPLEGERVQ